jgi:heme/copper-type cytochrome/quinol oxidase subunit 2
MIITLPDNYTLAAIIGICLIVVAWGVVLWRRHRSSKREETRKPPTVAPSDLIRGAGAGAPVDNLARIADALTKIANAQSATDGEGDVVARAEALAKQFEASAAIGISVGLPPVLVAKMIRQSILQEQANEEKV